MGKKGKGGGHRVNHWARAVKIASQRMKIKPPMKKGSPQYKVVKQIAERLKAGKEGM